MGVAVAQHAEYMGMDMFEFMRLLRPSVADLHIWTLLIFYPMISRRTLATFDCVDVLDMSYLRDDPATTCYTSSHNVVVILAFVGVVVYCLGIPALVGYFTLRQSVLSKKWSGWLSDRLRLLTRSYKADLVSFPPLDPFRHPIMD